MWSKKLSFLKNTIGSVEWKIKVFKKSTIGYVEWKIKVFKIKINHWLYGVKN